MSRKKKTAEITLPEDCNKVCDNCKYVIEVGTVKFCDKKKGWYFGREIIGNKPKRV